MASPISDEDSVDIIFHGAPYNLSATVMDLSPEPVLALDLEDIVTGATWHAEYTASYVESITSKTGNFKRFPVLVRMLLSAMRHQHDSVALDLLTYADLEALKAKKTGKAATGGVDDKAGKRYLILTYVVEFDRVHYPLPLAQQEAPSMPVLQRQIRRLRREVASYRALSGLPETSASLTASGLPATAQAVLVTSVAGMQREMDALRERNSDLLASERTLRESLRDAQSRCKAAQDAAAASDAALEKLRQASRGEVKRLRAEMGELRAKLAESESAVVAANEGAALMSGKHESEVILALKEANEQLRNRVRELTRHIALTTGGGGYTAGASATHASGRPSSASRVPVTASRSRGASPAPSVHSVGGSGASVRSTGSRSSATSPATRTRVSAAPSATTGLTNMQSRLATSPFAQPLPRRPSSASSQRVGHGGQPWSSTSAAASPTARGRAGAPGGRPTSASSSVRSRTSSVGSRGWEGDRLGRAGSPAVPPPSSLASAARVYGSASGHAPAPPGRGVNGAGGRLPAATTSSPHGKNGGPLLAHTAAATRPTPAERPWSGRSRTGSVSSAGGSGSRVVGSVVPVGTPYAAGTSALYAAVNQQYAASRGHDTPRSWASPITAALPPPRSPAGRGERLPPSTAPSPPPTPPSSRRHPLSTGNTPTPAPVPPPSLPRSSVGVDAGEVATRGGTTMAPMATPLHAGALARGSPGRTAGVAGPTGGGGGGATAPSRPTASFPPIPTTVGHDIADIDARLQQLQAFLRAAKAGSNTATNSSHATGMAGGSTV